MPCPDLTLALGGKVSMVGLANFGWIEGREVSSLSGSGGVIGELHVLGIPVGEARAFIASTDANGDPNPSLCGQAEVSLGPLDLAKVNLGLECEGCVTEFFRLFPTLAMAVGEPFRRESLGRWRPELVLGNPRPADLVNRVALLPPAERLPVMPGFLGDVQSASHLRLPGNLAEIVRQAVAAAWTRINPRLVLCGEIQPRLFGLPLTLGGRTAALNFLATKEGYPGAFAFSPSNLCPLFPPGDEAAFSFALQARAPYGVLLGAFDGRLNDPAKLAALVKEQVEYALQHQILAANYPWHPFGLELGDAAVRFLLPDVFEHPALPGSRWRNPDGRGHDGLPSRDDVLVAAAASGSLSSRCYEPERWWPCPSAARLGPMAFVSAPRAAASVCSVLILRTSASAPRTRWANCPPLRSRVGCRFCRRLSTPSGSPAICPRRAASVSRPSSA